MLQIKIHGATPQSGKSLCVTCKSGTIVKGQNCQELVRCHMWDETRYGGIVPFKIAECGSYHPSNMPYLHEMEGMSWKVEARKRGPVGFEPEKAEMEITITPPGQDKLGKPTCG